MTRAINNPRNQPNQQWTNSQSFHNTCKPTPRKIKSISFPWTRSFIKIVELGTAFSINDQGFCKHKISKIELQIEVIHHIRILESMTATESLSTRPPLCIHHNKYVTKEYIDKVFHPSDNLLIPRNLILTKRLLISNHFYNTTFNSNHTINSTYS